MISSFEDDEGDVGPLLLDEYRFMEYISGTDGGATFLGCGIDFCDRDITVDLFTEGAKKSKHRREKRSKVKLLETESST